MVSEEAKENLLDAGIEPWSSGQDQTPDRLCLGMMRRLLKISFYGAIRLWCFGLFVTNNIHAMKVPGLSPGPIRAWANRLMIPHKAWLVWKPRLFAHLKYVYVR